MEIEIQGRRIGPCHPVYVVAELSGNHLGDLERARSLVRAAAEAGADAVKLQTYRADTITIDARTPPFRIRGGTLWDGRVLHDLYAEAATPWEWFPELASLARDLGMHCFSSPFDPTAVDFLEAHGAPAYKIASFELVDVPLLQKVASTQKPIIVSAGMAELSEIDEAVGAIRAAGSSSIALLRANSGYPASPAEMNLKAIPYLAERFGVPVGLSDHSPGIAAAIAAVALGASIIEKHLTLARSDGGPDAAFSVEPAELSALVAGVRTAELAIGEARFGPTPGEQPSLAFRRSLFVVERVLRGEPFTRENVRSIRPSGGLHPRHLEAVLGRRAAKDLERGTPLAWELIE
jgi:N-acetylneuraminate synthase